MDLKIARILLWLQLVLLVVILGIQIVSIDDFVFFLALAYAVLTMLALWVVRRDTSNRVGSAFGMELIAGVFVAAVVIGGGTVSTAGLVVGLSCLLNVASLAFVWQRRL